jgi:GH24 family phage-related lysozyme (muramidase)
MTRSYSTFNEIDPEFFRRMIEGDRDTTAVPQSNSGIMSPSTIPQQRPDNLGPRFSDTPAELESSILGIFTDEMARSTDNPSQLADAVVPQPKRMETPRLEEYESMVPVEEFLRGDTTRAALGGSPDPVNVEGSTRGANVEMVAADGQPTRSAGNSSDADLVTRIEERLIPLEGFRGEAYKPVDTEEYYTIGYGHYGSNVGRSDTITEEQARQLLRQDIEERLPAIRRNIPDYDNLSPELQVEIAQGWFRGDISGSPKTIALINEGKFEEAASEFLDNEEYRTAEEQGKPGIISRMEAISAALRAEARR